MSDRSPLPGRDAFAALLGLGLLAAVFVVHDFRPGPGPLVPCAALAVFHAAVLAPSCRLRGNAGGALLPLLLAAPALFAAGFGHPWTAVLRAMLFVGLACLAGAAPLLLRDRPERGLYLPSMLLLCFVPLALAYLVTEFEGSVPVERLLQLSPLKGAEAAIDGSVDRSLAGALLLLAWPVWALARWRSPR